jgi:hypothetical protein
MVPWRFQDYWPYGGHNPIRIWEAGQDVDVRTAFDAVRDALAQTLDWLDPNVRELFRMLGRDERGLGEIVFETRFKRRGAKKLTDRNFRVFVKLRIPEHDCVLFVGSEKQRGTYNPLNARELARDYLARFERNEGFIDGHI